MSKTVERFYNEKYKDYVHPKPQTWLEHIYVRFKKYELHRNVAAAMLITKKTGRFLDIGCGFGDLVNKASKAGFIELHGIDISDEVVLGCKKNLQKQKIKAKISKQNIDEGLHYPNNYFSTITMVAVFEHIFSPHTVLSEISRILKKNGELIIEVPNVAFLPRRISFLLGKLPKTADEPNYLDGHLQFFTQKSLIELLTQHKFCVEYKGCSGILWRARNCWPTLLGANIVIRARKL